MADRAVAGPAKQEAPDKVVAPSTQPETEGVLPTSTGGVLMLQRTVGNKAVTDAVQRGALTVPFPREVQRRVQVQRDDKKTGIDRIREIHENTWIGPLDEYELQDLWSELGGGGAEKYPLDFAKSIEYGMEPADLAGADVILDAFKTTVKNLALTYLDGNLKDIEKEEQSLGIGKDKPNEGQEAVLQEVIAMAEMAKDLDELSKSFAGIQVGYQPKIVGQLGWQDFPASFQPGSPPQKPLKGGEAQPAKAYEETMARYEETMGALMAIANQHPTIYAALKSGSLDSITGKGDQMCTDPIAGIKVVLGDARKAIADTKKSVSTDDIDWEDLKPIHRQLLKGERNGGGYDWTSIWPKEIIKDEIGDYETTQSLIDLGIGMAAAVAFIFAEIATGGTATLLFIGAGVGIGAANVGRKYEKYDDLKTASAAGTSSATELVDKGQVDAAKLELIIESVMFFFDTIGVAVKGAKGLAKAGITAAGKKAAEEAAGAAALKGLKTMAPKEAGELVAKSVDSVGVKAAADGAGMSVEDMLKLVPADSPAAAKISSFLKLAAEGVDPAKLPDALRSALKGGEVVGAKGAKLSAEDVVKQAIDQLGFQKTLKEAGGWKTLSAALGPSSEVGQRLKAWRDGIYADLKKYIESLRTPADGDGPLIKETGTLENVTNDLDISFLGPKASENRMKAAQFLGGRTGLGADPGVLDKLIYVGLFTDPNRMHLFDKFPQLQSKLARSTMKVEEELIWNDELHKYLVKGAKGDAAAQAMAEKIAGEMEALGVKRMPGYKPLTSRAADVLTKGQDDLHAAIEAAANAGDFGKADQLIEQLGAIQAQINIKEGGGYFSAGGVRKFVTDAENFPGARAAPTAAHDLGAALDQVNKLRKSIAAFEAEAMKLPASRDATELAKSIKDLSKYGDRFRAAAEVIGAKAPDPAQFNALADEFSQLILQARGQTVHTMQELLAKNMDGVIGKTRSAIALFDQQHVAILKALRERAAIDGMQDLAPDIIRATKARYALLTFQSGLTLQMGTAARAVGIPLREAVLPDDEVGPAAKPGPAEKGDFPVQKPGDPVPA